MYGKLLNLFKVKATFSARDYIEALRRMAVDSGADRDEGGLDYIYVFLLSMENQCSVVKV